MSYHQPALFCNLTLKRHHLRCLRSQSSWRTRFFQSNSLQWILPLLAIFIFPTFAFGRPDYKKCEKIPSSGFQEPSQTRCRSGVADRLNPSERKVYEQVRSKMDRQRFKQSRKQLVGLLLNKRNHPRMRCQDRFDKKGATLSCQSGPETFEYKSLMTSDLNKSLDKNMITPLESASGLESSSGESKNSPAKERRISGETRAQMLSGQKDPYQGYIYRHIARKNLPTSQRKNQSALFSNPRVLKQVAIDAKTDSGSGRGVSESSQFIRQPASEENKD